MMGLEVILHKLVGGNDAFLMLGALFLLIGLNFITDMWVEIKNKDLRWNDLSRFGKPVIFNAIFLLGLELVMIPASRTSLAYEIFYNIQMLGWVGVMGVYVYELYKNLKALGWKGSRRLEDSMSDYADKEEEK